MGIEITDSQAARTQLNNEELEAVRLDRMTNLADTSRVIMNGDSIDEQRTPAEIVRDAIEAFNSGGYDEVTQTLNRDMNTDVTRTTDNNFQPL